MNAISLQNVAHTYGSDTAQVHALHQLNFSAQAGTLNLVLGPSGSGKTTFLTIAGGLLTPTTGEVTIAGQNYTTLSKKQQDALRLSSIGFVLQAYQLLPYLKVKEQFKLVSQVKKTGNLSAAKLAEVLDMLEITDLLNKYPSELSGGQQQRVAIARALYPNPAIILADEPTAALDSQKVKVVGQLLADLAHQHDKAVIVVTHDPRLIEFADQIYDITDGVLTHKDTVQA